MLLSAYANYFKMKKILIFLALFTFICIVEISCTSTVHINSSGKVPPGQEKKMTGSQSAKPYAPGQQKKETGKQSAKEQAPGQQKKDNKELKN